MANYIVGDLQGCLDELESLLAKVDFSPRHDQLWIAGDLVARGPKSLETLRYIKSLGNSAKTVLGNHDLHLLSIELGVHPLKKKDRTASIFQAPDRGELIEWLRFQPLLLEHQDFVLCHAGISPHWDLPTARQAAQEVESILQSDQWPWLIENMYSNMPNQWHNSLKGLERYRYIINAFTRMRFCTPDGALDMDCKLPPSEVNSHQLIPWFDLPRRSPIEKRIIFGHWAALEGCVRKDVIGLDTGCVWGGTLTMIRWEDQQLFRQPAMSGIQVG
ncbi:bis(5'-nucleosyl)-tetraphosphatase (symmetrical) ApaH [Vibrio mangrovi]|uniref:Bis(5'-nucleosyl)-tetraphosphatase, symmetrical n=1 Tax=Vibrio mangrovi TaxID=474394 RepID=A0A1Y6IXQ4_9VIBR|nr:bis(5'-nucleosyl)-tetraphosphatase (symmetrical) ApaH [Vibrio mangrovi]MDW6001994.1 bis(5'-nucleosyl)-tetraphosphatase (symmetrical) ApaH [Vibrio mangrovi]SMS02459.1 Bis(5'-nucleosyl)-tetraphosphatase [symmetrical] [Vibrio mangrovi]